MSGRIVVGVDGSSASLQALAFAVEESKRRNAQIEALMAFRWRSSIPALGFGSLESPPFEKVEAEAMATLLEAIADVPDDVPIDPIVREGSASHVLLEAAEGADLVIVGARGHGGFAGLLLGSTSHQVISHAPCPAVVVPAKNAG